MIKRAGNPILFLALAAVMAFAAGCTKPATRCTSPEDNPKHHYLKAMEQLENNKLNDAKEKFERATFCDDDFGPAHAGLGIVYARIAAAEKDQGHRNVDAGKSMDELKLGSSKAQTPEDEFAYNLAVIRAGTARKGDKWIGRAEDAFRDAMKLKVDEKKLIYYDGREAAMYFMGLAYLENKDFQRARDRFSDVLAEKNEGKWNGPAEKGWKRVDKIVRAMAGITVSDVGKQIAVKDSVTKGDMAALLLDELKVDKLFAGRIPVKSQVDAAKADFTPADVLQHQFKDEILTLMKWKVRGLEPLFDETTRAYLFKPDAPVSRRELAFALEDVLAKIMGDESITTKFVGTERSPFPDVPASSAGFNSAMNMTTRNIMETELSGEFRPSDPVDGAEAMLAIRVLRHVLNIH